MDYSNALKSAVILFENRVFKHRKDKLFVTKFSKKLSIQLHKKAKKDVNMLQKVLYS